MREQRIIDELEKRYNPECDLIRDAPAVTWTDYALLTLVQDLYKRVNVLESRLEEVESDVGIIHF